MMYQTLFLSVIWLVASLQNTNQIAGIGDDVWNISKKEWIEELTLVIFKLNS